MQMILRYSWIFYITYFTLYIGFLFCSNTKQFATGRLIIWEKNCCAILSWATMAPHQPLLDEDSVGIESAHVSTCPEICAKKEATEHGTDFAHSARKRSRALCALDTAWSIIAPVLCLFLPRRTNHVAGQEASQFLWKLFGWCLCYAVVSSHSCQWPMARVGLMFAAFLWVRLSLTMDPCVASSFALLYTRFASPSSLIHWVDQSRLQWCRSTQKSSKHPAAK
jgi:hypothetical protein